MRYGRALPLISVLLAGGTLAWMVGARADLRRLPQPLRARLSPPELQRVGGHTAATVSRLRGKPELLDVSALSSEEAGSWPEPDPAALQTDAPADEPSSDLVASYHPSAVAHYQSPRAEVDPDRALAVVGREAFVFEGPSFRERKLGYLRTGAVLERSEASSGTRGCPGGWYRIQPAGFVCVGTQATLDLEHPLVRATARRPDRTAALPYAYGLSRFPTPPFYTKVPSVKEQRSVELDLERHLALGTAKAWQDVPRDPIPALLENGKPSFTWGGGRHSPRSVYTGRALPQSGFALLSTFESEGRAFGLSVDLDVMPLDRLKRVKPSEFHGVVLDEQTPLPIVFVRSRGAFVYAGDPRSTGLRAERPLAFREAVPITGKALRAGGVRYLEVRGGGYLRDEHLVRINPMKNRPGWATPGRTWIDVSILKQALVAYEGATPVYATLVSTGADGLGDPEKTHSTVRGQFLIHTKHVTATMSGDVVGDEFDLRDVPYVQYFTEGYALHAAYWHDSFGTPRSHGCINLSPLDANWLFGWTDPPVPDRWHAAMSLRQGTLVYVHP